MYLFIYIATATTPEEVAVNIFGNPPATEESDYDKLEYDDIKPGQDSEMEDSKKDAFRGILISGTCPNVVYTYNHANTFVQKVVVVLTLPSGVTTCKVRLDESSRTATGGTNAVVIEYDWGLFSYDPECLYSQCIAAGKMTQDHPKIQAMRKELTKLRGNINEAPKSTLKILLPIVVQTSDDTWDYTTIAHIDSNGFSTQNLEIELTELQKKYTTKKRESTAVFQITDFKKAKVISDDVQKSK
jgi:hypothetical protein